MSPPPRPRSGDTLLSSYRRLAAVFCDVLAEQSLEPLRKRIADALFELLPNCALTLYEADEGECLLVPVLSRGRPPAPARPLRFGTGTVGQAVALRQALLVREEGRPRLRGAARGAPSGGSSELLVLPLIARGSVRGALALFRQETKAGFGADELELAQGFAQAAALALANAHLVAELEERANVDPLTGLANRRAFFERLSAELARAARRGDPLTLLLLDIDDFKRVNDRHGHPTGDELLALLAATLRACVREGDVACRIGGDEFALILPSCPAADGRAFARRLARRLAALEVVPGERLTVSIGLCEGRRESLTAEALVAGADAALLRAKASRKKRIAPPEGDARFGAPA